MHARCGFAGSAMLTATIIVTLAATALGQTVDDPNLSARTASSGLVTPSTMAFIGTSDILIGEKNTGKVLRITNGVVTGAVLDRAVNFASERGLLGMALHPQFPANRGVYLYWTES